MTYIHNNPSIDAESFCEEWELKSYELDAALAKLQKQGKLYREPKIVQLELFESGEGKTKKVLSTGVQLRKDNLASISTQFAKNEED